VTAFQQEWETYTVLKKSLHCVSQRENVSKRKWIETRV